MGGRDKGNILLRRANIVGTENCGGEKARAGRAFIFPIPLFLPVPPERWGGKRLVLASASQQSLQKLFP
jgi:hypothetical protein